MSSLVGLSAPNFVAKAAMHQRIVDQFSLDMYRGKAVILLFYPLDFTFVCPTELHAFQEASPLFEVRNVHLIGISVDSVYAHMAWLSQPRMQGGIEGVRFPLVSDITKDISRKYGVLNQEEGVSYRGLFFIDADGIVRHQIVNDLPLGRSVDEALRVVDAWHHIEQHGEVCPANWRPGASSMTPTQDGLRHYLTAGTPN